MKKTYLVAYDVSADKRRTKVFDLLSGYGEWLQYSVFRCPLDATATAQLETELRELVNEDEDQVLFFDLGPSSGNGATPTVVVGRACKPLRMSAIIL